jgi:hypothetical protein
MDIEERREFIFNLINSDLVKVPVLLGFCDSMEDDECMGDVYIYEKQVEELSKVYYEVFITSIENGVPSLNQTAVRVGLKELFKKLKAEKVAVDTIYVHQECCMNHKDVSDVTLQLQDILLDYRLEDKVRIWAENLESVDDEDDDECCGDCDCKEKEKNKPKKKNKKDKKKKKKGKKK